MISIIIPTLHGASSETEHSINKQSVADLDITIVKGVRPNGKARNNGARSTEGEIVVFIDDDAVLAHEDVLKHMVEPILKGQADIVGASRRLPKDSSWFARMAARQLPLVETPIVDTLTDATPSLQRTSWLTNLFKNPISVLTGTPDQTVWSSITTTCVAMRREVWQQLGGFNEELQWGVDTEFFYRAARAGFRMAIAPYAWVYHPYVNNLKDIWRKYYKSGLGTAQEMRLHPERNLQPVLDSLPAFIWFTLYRLIGGVLILFIKPLRGLASLFSAFGYIRGSLQEPIDTLSGTLKSPYSFARQAPYLFLLLAVFFSPLTRLGTLDFGFTLKISEVLLAVGLILYMLYLLVFYNIPKSQPSLFQSVLHQFKDPLVLILMGYTMVAVASLSHAINLTRGLAILAQTTLFMWGLLYVPSFYIRNKEQLREILSVFITASMLLAIFAVFQFFGDFLSFNVGLRNIYVKARTGYPRVHGTMLEPLYMAHYLMGPIGLLSSAAVFGRSVLKWSTMTILSALFVILWAFNLGFSRGGWIGLIGMVGVLIIIVLIHYLRARTVRWWSLGAWLVVVLASFVVMPISIMSGKFMYDVFGQHYEEYKRVRIEQEVKERPERQEDLDEYERESEVTRQRVQTNSAFKFLDDRIGRFFDLAVGRRKEAWETAANFIQQSPWIGVGIGNFGYQERSQEDGLAGVNFVNNQPLEILAETGLLGFMFFVLFNLIILWYTWLTYQTAVTRRDTDMIVLTVGLFLAYVGMNIQFLTVSNWNVLHYWLVLGMMYWSYKITIRE